jgi:peptide/nickel transport system substrate-binding protein
MGQRHFIPYSATAAAALQTGEIDWIERPLLDLVPSLKTAPGVAVTQVDPMGFFAILWVNNAAPPFDNAKLLPAAKRMISESGYAGEKSGFVGAPITAMWKVRKG